ncbi:MAG: hypothetical protein EBR86_12460 [Planctomycetia bacterium]|nr:hypothetical protein [Planctomycetia bacterium]
MDPGPKAVESAASGLLEQLASRGAHLVVTAAGGGSAAVAALAGTPGASRVLVEGLVPHAREAVDRLLGGPQETYCSSRASRRLAVHGWSRARLPQRPFDSAVGAAVTASLATSRAKQGDHRVIVAVQSLAATAVHTLRLEKGARSRADEETVAAWLLLAAVTAETGGNPQPQASLLRPGEEVTVERVEAPQRWQDLLAAARVAVSAADGRAPGDEPGRVVFPGSFDPLHDGHRGMAALAGSLAGRPVEYELSVTNVDKPPLDHMELTDRVRQFPEGRLWLTRAPTFVEKVAIFPRAVFVLGADTFSRLWDRRYYGGSAAAAAEAVAAIAAGVEELIVFGRVRDGVFADAAAGHVPESLRGVSRFVPEDQFRSDLSSTHLRHEQSRCTPP